MKKLNQSFTPGNLLFRLSAVLILILFISASVYAQGTRLLRQPAVSSEKIVFAYGGDLWVCKLDGKDLKRLTSTPAVESDPHFSPDGKTIAFTSNRSGISAVYVMSVEGGDPVRLTWYPASATALGWTPDGKNILYSSNRETAPTAYDRLWLVPKDGGYSTLLYKQWGTDGAFSPDGKKIVADRISRWDKEWRNYRGGQNSSLYILDLDNMNEVLIPNEKRTIDIQPVWLDDMIYFLSDRDWIVNIWSYSHKSGELKQVTKFTGTDIKWLNAGAGKLTFEREGYINILDPKTGNVKQLEINVIGDFPWAETKWEDVSSSVNSVSLSPTGKRALMESRGEIFTVPVKHGNSRNLTKSSDAADRSPIWSPKGDKIAWFSDKDNKGYKLFIADQDGLSEPKTLSIGESKFVWIPSWSPDGKYIAFCDDEVRIQVIEIETGKITTADVGGNNIERGNNGITWSPDSKWLAYSKSGSNNFRQIFVWSLETKTSKPLTDPFADSFSPSWDRNGKQLYFLASTDVALASGWANTSAMTADPSYAAYLINLRADDQSPFSLRSDEEKEVKDKPEKNGKENEKKTDDTKAAAAKPDKAEKKDTALVKIDFGGIERRIIPLPIPARSYRFTLSGPEGSVFIAEIIPNTPGFLLKKFSLEKREAEDFIKSARQVSVSADGKQILFQEGTTWKVAGTAAPVGTGGDRLNISLKMNLDRLSEWNQIFEEAWRYEKNHFYDPGMHGRDWDEVYDRYSPLIKYVRHRADLNYIIDQVNGELSVGHSFVGGGDYPNVDENRTGLPGADLIPENGRWKIARIFTSESWNPELSAPLDKPGLKVKEGNYIVGIDGNEITDKVDPYKYFDGTAGTQVVLHINDKPEFENSWEVIIQPIASDRGLRQRAWVEDNRKLVDKLSDGKLAYVWVPNTGGPGVISFNRYFFAQQDKEGAVIDERFNGGGLLDDYMVDLMTRSLRAALTNEVPDGKPFRLPAGILGPKVLLINELSGSGGDFFPWVFRQQNAGPLIGMRTWGGLVKSSVHYRFVDGSTATAPDNAVFDPINKKWIAENEGVPADIEVRLDAKSLSEGRDVQLERAVKETLELLKEKGSIKVENPPYPKPAVKK
ncbi:MAG TPA: PDZ domain-containing protein [Melioribacteraceae bacterium]|nr:PDZ domain-containing protein [Melioribacteraceae bacterium]